MITFSGRGFDAFYAAFRLLREAGVEVMATGANTGRIPDGTDLPLLHTLAALPGVAVHTTLPAPDPATGPARPARRARKATTAETGE